MPVPSQGSSTLESDNADDDADAVREQNLRALLVSLPATFVDAVVKEALRKAVLEGQRLAYVRAESRRRRLLATSLEFRHTKSVATALHPTVRSLARTSVGASRIAPYPVSLPITQRATDYSTSTYRSASDEAILVVLPLAINVLDARS